MRSAIKITAAEVFAVLFVLLAGPVSAQEKISDRDVVSAVGAAFLPDGFVLLQKYFSARLKTLFILNLKDARGAVYPAPRFNAAREF